MSNDWDVFAPVEAAPQQIDAEDEQVSGCFNDDVDSMDNSLGSVSDSLEPMMGPASFQPRMLSDLRKNHNRRRSNAFDPSRSSYSERKLHLGDDFKGKGRRTSHRRRDIRDHELVSHELMQPGGYDEAKYLHFRESALKQRETAGIGKSPEMNSLFYFWCYYLRNNFDQAMYDEFLKLAKEDAEAPEGASHYAIECFFRLCSYGLESRWDEKVFDDFQREAALDFGRGSKYGIEKVKAFLIHQKHVENPPVSEEMKAILEQFPTLDSFKDPNEPPKEERKRSRRPSQVKEGSFTEASSIPKPSGMAGEKRRRPGNRGRNNRAKQFNNEPRDSNWQFGRMHPSSMPQDSPMRSAWKQ